MSPKSNLHGSENTARNVRRQPTEPEQLCQSEPAEGPDPEYIKNSRDSVRKRQVIPFINGPRRHLPKDGLQMANKPVKRCSRPQSSGKRKPQPRKGSSLLQVPSEYKFPQVKSHVQGRRWGHRPRAPGWEAKLCSAAGQPLPQPGGGPRRNEATCPQVTGSPALTAMCVSRPRGLLSAGERVQGTRFP